MPVTMADIEKPEIRMKRLNSLLHDTQIELLNAKATGKTRQERKELKKRCQDLDEKLDNVHNEYQDYLSESNVNSLNSDREFDLSTHTQPPSYKTGFECEENNIRNTEAALRLAFAGLGCDPTSLLNDVRKNPFEFTDDKRPVVRDFCEAIQAYNRAKIAAIHYTSTSSLKNLREYVDHRIENLARFENLAESCMAQILELEHNVAELTLRSDARILKLERAVNYLSNSHLGPSTLPSDCLHATALLCIGDTTGFDCLRDIYKKQLNSTKQIAGVNTTEVSVSYLTAAVISGDCEVVKHVLEGMSSSTYDDPQKRYKLSEYHWNKQHPLCYATSRGHLDIVRLLFECGAEIEPHYEFDVPATDTGDKIRELILNAGGKVSKSVSPNPEWLKLII